MQELLIFILFTVAFVLAGLAWLRLFAIMISEGQILDQLFGWQAMLSRLYQSPKRWKNLAGKALGDCEVCTAYWFQPFWFAAYYGFCRLALHYFITDEAAAWWAKIFVGFLWYMVFHAIGAIAGMMTLIQAKKRAALLTSQNAPQNAL